jgi:hypothetical protein
VVLLTYVWGQFAPMALAAKVKGATSETSRVAVDADAGSATDTSR